MKWVKAFGMLIVGYLFVGFCFDLIVYFAGLSDTIFGRLSGLVGLIAGIYFFVWTVKQPEKQEKAKVDGSIKED